MTDPYNNPHMSPFHFSRANLVEIAAPDLGRMLRGVGLNLLVKDAASYAHQLQAILNVDVIRADQAFALIAVPTYQASDNSAENTSITDGIAVYHLIQIHADKTYHQNPYYDHLPSSGPRGAGVELHLFETDPDACVARASADPDWTVLQGATDKPHGVREAYLLDDHGYCWVVSRPL